MTTECTKRIRRSRAPSAVRWSEVVDNARAAREFVDKGRPSDETIWPLDFHTLLQALSRKPSSRYLAMKSNRLTAALAAMVALLLFCTDLASAQDLHPSRRPSPVGIARTHIGDAYVKVTYGRPYMRGREIFGENTSDMTYLVPFGEIWRTGANEATEITFTEPLRIDGHRVEVGTYAIFTIPGRDEWQVHFSPQLGLDGTAQFNPATGEFEPAYDRSEDVLTIDVPVHRLDDSIDQFTISFDETETGADLVLRWERTEVRIPFQESS